MKSPTGSAEPEGEPKPEGESEPEGHAHGESEPEGHAHGKSEPEGHAHSESEPEGRRQGRYQLQAIQENLLKLLMIKVEQMCNCHTGTKTIRMLVDGSGGKMEPRGCPKVRGSFRIICLHALPGKFEKLCKII